MKRIIIIQNESISIYYYYLFSIIKKNKAIIAINTISITYVFYKN